MDSTFKKLSHSAYHLIQQKELLEDSQYRSKMESILEMLAQQSISEQEYYNPGNLGIVEKMSFEIRTPMNSILGFTGLLRDNYFTTNEKDEFIALIEKNTELLIEILNDLASLSRVENLQISLKMEKFELNVFLLDVILHFQERARELNVKFFKSKKGTVQKDTCVYTDPYQLRHIIDYLVQNLFKFNRNSNIELSTEILKGPFLVIKLCSDQKDFPESISQSIKRHVVFDPDQENFDSSGLKLTLVKALVDLLNGDVSFHANKDGGSEFVLKIPIKVCKL